MKKIIAAIGYSRSGKDEFANVLVKEFGFTRFAFADKVRECLYALNPIVGGDFWDHSTIDLQTVIDGGGWNGYKETLYADEIRRLLQRIGTEVGRDLIAKDVWLKELDKVDTSKIVVTDARFLNELDYLKHKGAFVIRVHRDGFGPANDHSSEVEIDQFKPNLTFYNNKSLESYQAAIRDFASYVVH